MIFLQYDHIICCFIHNISYINIKYIMYMYLNSTYVYIKNNKYQYYIIYDEYLDRIELSCRSLSDRTPDTRTTCFSTTDRVITSIFVIGSRSWVSATHEYLSRSRYNCWFVSFRTINFELHEYSKSLISFMSC